MPLDPELFGRRVPTRQQIEARRIAAELVRKGHNPRAAAIIAAKRAKGFR